MSAPSFMRCTYRLTGHAISSITSSKNGAAAIAKNVSMTSTISPAKEHDMPAAKTPKKQHKPAPPPVPAKRRPAPKGGGGPGEQK